MTDERKPVMCPWCGGEMKLDEPTAYGWECSDGNWCSDGYICPVCGGSSGGVYGCATCEECRRLAYENATQKPPNRPLTLEQNEITRIRLLQYESLRKNFYALIESVLGEDYYNLGMDVYTCDAMACEDIANKIGAKWIAQPADIEAARKGCTE